LLIFDRYLLITILLLLLLLSLVLLGELLLPPGHVYHKVRAYTGRRTIVEGDLSLLLFFGVFASLAEFRHWRFFFLLFFAFIQTFEAADGVSQGVPAVVFIGILRAGLGSWLVVE